MKFKKHKKIIILLFSIAAITGSVGYIAALNGYFGGGDTIPEDTMTRGLVASWDFDEGSGDVAYDATTNNNHGNFPHTGPGLKFQGDDDYVNCGSDANLNITAAITVEAWVKPDILNAYQAIVNQFSNSNNLGEVQLRISNDGKFQWMRRNSQGAVSARTITTNTVAVAGQWQHIVGVFDGTNYKVYINSVVDSATDVASSYTASQVPKTKIGIADNGVYPFNGAIDEVRIYSRAITAAEVNEHYHGIFSDNTGRVGYWPFDEGEGDVVDNSGTCGAACDGDLNGYTPAQQVAGYGDTNPTGWTTLAAPLTDSAPSWTSGKDGGGLAFDGENDYVNFSSNPISGSNQPHTISAWFNRGAGAGQRYIVGLGAGVSYDESTIRIGDCSGGLGSDREIMWEAYGSVTHLCSGVNLEQGIWTFAVVTFDGTNAKIYVNGEYKAERTLASALSLANVLKIGQRGNGSGFHFNGSIDGVKIYNRALSAEEVRYHYNRGGPVAHWKFDEGEGAKAYDESGNRNHGTIYGTTGTADAGGAAATLVDATKAWTTNEWAGETVEITTGTGSGQTRTVSSNTATALTVSAVWANNPDATSVYRVTSKDEWTTGKHKTGLSFDGVDDYVDCGNDASLDITTALTHEAWIYPTAYPAIAGGIVMPEYAGGDRRLIFNVKSTGRISMSITNTTNSWDSARESNIAVELNEWSHVVGIYDGSDIHLYINGVLSDGTLTGTVPSSCRTTAQSMLIGRYGTYYFDGSIDDVRIYPYARSADEIRLDYNAGFAAKFGGSNRGQTPVSCSSDPAACMDYGLVASYNMDEGGGDTLYNAADTGSANDGVLGSGIGADTNDPKWTKGESGTGLEFDGVNDYVNCGNDASLDITDAITIEAWVKWNQILTSGSFDGGILVSKASGLIGWQIGIDANDLVFYTRSAGGISKSYLYSASNLTLNQWYHIVGTRNIGGTFTLYVDGVDVGQTTPTKRDISTSYNVRIGVGYSNDFNGSIDGVKIYNRALSAEEVRYHYNRGGPVAHWKFDEGVGVNVNNDRCRTPVQVSDIGHNGNIRSSALDFVTDDYVNCGSDSSLDFGTGSFTIEGWIKITEGSRRQYSLGSCAIYSAGQQGIASEIYSSNTHYFSIRDSNDVCKEKGFFAAPIGEWYYFVFVVDRTANEILGYFNGAYQGTLDISALAGGTIVHTNDLLLGDGYGFSSLHGAIDEVRIYNKALHADTIANHYKGDFSSDEKDVNDVALTADDLVLYIPFDDAAGDAATNYGTCGGVPSNCDGDLNGYTAAEQVAKYGDSNTTGWVIDTDWTTARQGTGLEFGGVNGFFQSDDYIASASAFSHSLWFRSADGAYSDEYLFSQGDDDPSAYIDSNGKVNIKVDGDASAKITSIRAVSDTQWHHIEITGDGTNLKLYLDGVLDGSAAWAGSSDDAGISAGAHISRSGFFDGTIDDFKVYSYARSADEIRLDYNAGYAVRLGGLGNRVSSSGNSVSNDCSNDPASCVDYGLVASYDFDEGSGDTLYNAADTGRANDGTLGSAAGADTSDPKWVSVTLGGVSDTHGGSALQFDGVNDYVNCGNDPSLDITSAITIEAWVKPTDVSNPSTNVVLSKGNGTPQNYVLRVNPQEVLFFYANPDGTWKGLEDDGRPLSNNVWYHLVAVQYSDGSIDFYQNGVVNAGTLSPGLGNPVGVSKLENAHPLVIGNKNGYSQYFNGSIDGVKIYNRALSAEEVRYHYNRGGPVAHWKFDEGEGAKAFDESGHRNHGTLTGSTSGTADSGSATTLVDTVLTQAEDYWKDYTLKIVTTTNALAPQGETATITGFAAGTDTLTFAALTAAVAADDTYKLYYGDEDGPTWSAGHSTAAPGSALSFDGADDYIDCGNDSSLNITSAITVSAWVNIIAGTPSYGGGIVTKFDAWTTGGLTLYVGGGSDINWGLATVGGASVVAQGNAYNQWIHAVGVWDGTTQSLYINGNLLNTATPSNVLLSAPTKNLLMGKIGTLGYFNGSIDDVKIYNYARSPLEILQDYNSGLAAHLK